MVPSFFFEKSMWPSLWELSSRVVLYLPFSRVPKEQFLCQFLGLVPRKCWQYKFRSHRHIRLSPCFGIFMSLTPSMWRKKKFLSSFYASEWTIFQISSECSHLQILNLWEVLRSNSLSDIAPESHLKFPYWFKLKFQGS